MSRTTSGAQRILRLAHEFAEEMRADLARASAEGNDLPPRIRTVHDRPGQTSPDLRTLAVPIPQHAEGASPTVLSGAIARFAARRPPTCLLLTLDVIGTDERGGPQPIFIVEARDRAGNRLFLAHPYVINEGKIEWLEPADGGWRDPGGEEMIIDAAFDDTSE